MKADDQGNGWMPVPNDTLVDEGLLRRVNRDFFWPLGLALTASETMTQAERVEPVVQRLSEGLDLSSGQMALLREHVAEAVSKPSRLAGLFVQATVPPDVIQSALSPEDAAEKDARADAWIAARKAAIG